MSIYEQRFNPQVDLLTGLKHGSYFMLQLDTGEEYKIPRDIRLLVLNGEINHFSGTQSLLRFKIKGATINQWTFSVASATASSRVPIWLQIGGWSPIVLTGDHMINFSGDVAPVKAYVNLTFLRWDTRTEYTTPEGEKKKGFWRFLNV